MVDLASVTLGTECCQWFRAADRFCRLPATYYEPNTDDDLIVGVWCCQHRPPHAVRIPDNVKRAPASRWFRDGKIGPAPK